MTSFKFYYIVYGFQKYILPKKKKRKKDDSQNYYTFSFSLYPPFHFFLFWSLHLETIVDLLPIMS